MLGLSYPLDSPANQKKFGNKTKYPQGWVSAIQQSARALKPQVYPKGNVAAIFIGDEGCCYNGCNESNYIAPLTKAIRDGVGGNPGVRPPSNRLRLRLQLRMPGSVSQASEADCGDGSGPAVHLCERVRAVVEGLRLAPLLQRRQLRGPRLPVPGNRQWLDRSGFGLRASCWCPRARFFVSALATEVGVTTSSERNATRGDCAAPFRPLHMEDHTPNPRHHLVRLL